MTTGHSNNTQNNNLAQDAAFTPLASTRDAPFMIQVDDNRTAPSNDSRFANKLRQKTAILQSVPETRSIRAESHMSTQSNAAPGEWAAGFASCLDCRTGTAGELTTLICCPCIPAAKVHGLLGASFESGMLYFGGLVFAMLISFGLSCSNTSSTMSAALVDTGANSSNHPSMDDGRFVAKDADPTTQQPEEPIAHSHIYGNLALVLLALFLVGVAYLRTKTRHRFNIPGARVVDLLLSIACCWCVLAQTHRHVDKHHRHECGLDTPTDTLPAYL